MAPVYSSPQIERIQELLKRIADGRLLVPRFLREFVWQDDQRLSLFRSIYRGLPIGSIFTWITRDHHLASFERIGLLRLGPPQTNQPRTYLLDGHQRLATLLTSLGPGLEIEEMGAGDETLELLRPIYFDLESQDFELEPATGSVPSHWVPLSELFALGPFYAKQRELTDAGKEKLARRLEYLAATFKDYRIPVVALLSEDLDLVTEGLRLINIAGSGLSLFHMVHALTWSPEFDLGSRTAEILQSLEPGWQSLEQEVLLRIVKAILDLDVFESDAVRISEAFASEDREELLDRSRLALGRALRFLDEELSIRSQELLPYTNQLVVLAEALRLDSGEEPSTRLKEALREWFWVTSYTELFSGASAKRMDRALKQIRRIRNGGPTFTSGEIAVGPVQPPPRFNWNTARSRISLWRLAQLKMKVSGKDGYDPFALLAAGPRACVMRVAPPPHEALDVEGIENRVLLPREMQEDFRTRLRAGQLGHLEMDAHAIDAEAVSAFTAGDLATFFRRRRQAILEEEAKFVSSLGLQYELQLNLGS